MPTIKIADSLGDLKTEIPLSKSRLVVLGGRRICLSHTRTGIFAVDDTCPHLGESLSKGTTNYLDEVVCPWHSYRFSLHTGAECQHRTRDLQRYKIMVEKDGVYLEV